MNKRIFTALLTTLLILSMAGSAMCLPSTFDWRDVNGTNYMTPPKSQGACGACWDFAAISAIEAAYKIYCDPSIDMDLSEQYFISDCFPNGDCDGGWIGGVLSVALHDGIPSEECYPYTASGGDCSPCAGWENDTYMIEGFHSVGMTTEAYKQAIFNHGPVVSCKQLNEKHSICVVGWDDTTSNWIYKNSYGPTWNGDGYGEIPFGDIETLDDAYVITGILKDWVSPISAIASSTFNVTGIPMGGPDAAIDGVRKHGINKWASDEEVPCWIQFDLGSQMCVDSLYLAMGSPSFNPTVFTVSASTDNVTWFPITGNVTPIFDDTMFEVPIDAVKVRYIKLDILYAITRGSCLEFGIIALPACGDFDHNCDVDEFDFVEFCAAYGSSIGDPNYDPIGDFCGDGDPEPDGDIDAFDFVEFCAVYDP